MHTLGRITATAVILLSCLATARQRCRAQFRTTTQLVTVPGASLAASDDAYAADLNPAALAFTPSWSLRYLHVDASSRDVATSRGDALYFATPLFWKLALGASAQSIRPTDASGVQRRGAFSLSLAYAGNRTWGIGGTLRYFGSLQPNVDDLVAVDLGLTLRPSPYLAVSLLAYDVLGPLDLTGYNATVDMSAVLAVAARPWGDDRLTLEVAPGIDTDGRAGVRTMLEVAFPHLGKLQATGEFADLGGSPQLRAMAGMAIDWGHVGLSGGVWLGDGLQQQPGWYVGARLEGTPRDGLPMPRVIADLQVNEELGARGLLRLLEQLSAAERQPRIAAVMLRLRGSGIGLSDAQELRQAIRRLQKAGKPVFCHLDAASGSEAYACAAAGELWIDPAGGLRLTGLGMQTLLFGDLLNKVGVRADFVRSGKFKSAPEQWMQNQSSPEAVQQRQAYLDDAYARLTADLASDRKLSPEQAQQLVSQGPYLADEAVGARLATREGDEHELDDMLTDALGKGYARREAPLPEVRRSWGIRQRIGVVVVDGTMIDGDNLDIPFLDIHSSGGRTVAQAIEDLAADNSVAAIVLRVDSPGGSALASDQIWRALRRARRQKPVIASLGSVAASGGYYIASAAKEIWADPSTLTGSIGVFYGKVDVAGLAEKLGVSIEEQHRGERAGVESIWRPFTDDERAMLATKVEKWYQMFLKRVATGRGMRTDQVHAVAQGRIWSGDSALKVGLVDRLGGYNAALARARQLTHLPADAPTVVVPKRPERLLDYLLPEAGERTAQSVSRLPQATLQALSKRTIGASVRQAMQTWITLTNARADVPFAWLPDVVSAP